MTAPQIPYGIQVLVKKASVDPDFRELLLVRRARAADEIELSLHDAEKSILNDVPADQLEAMIDRTDVPPEERPVFLGKAVIPMLAVAGVATAGCTMGCRIDRVPRPQHPPPTAEEVDALTPEGQRDAAAQPEADPERTKPLSKGIRPDRPMPKK